MHHRLSARPGSDPPKPVPPHQFWGYLLTRTKPRLPAVPATRLTQSHQSSLATLAHNRPDFSTQSTRPTASSPLAPKPSIPAGFRRATFAHLRLAIWLARHSGTIAPVALHGRRCHRPPQKRETAPDRHLIVRPKTGRTKRSRIG